MLSGLLLCVGLLTGGSRAEGSTAPCEPEAVTDCLTQYRALGVLGATVLPDLTADQLATTCRNWQDLRHCYGEVKAACSRNASHDNELRASMQSMSEAYRGYEHLCQPDVRTAYLRTARPCLETERSLDVDRAAGEEGLKATSARCLEVYHNATWWRNRQDGENRSKFCKAAQEYLSCVRGAVKAACGGGAASWVADYLQVLWGPHLDDIDCQPGGGMEAGAIVIMTLAVGATGYCIFFIVLDYIRSAKCCKGKSGKYTPANSAADVM